MSRILLFIPTVTCKLTLTNLILGVILSIEARKIPVAFFKPIGQWEESGISVAMQRKLKVPDPISSIQAHKIVSERGVDGLLEQILAMFARSDKRDEITVVEGVIPSSELPFAERLNAAIASALDATTVLVFNVRAGNMDNLTQLLELRRLCQFSFTEQRLAGVIINQFDDLPEWVTAVSGMRGNKKSPKLKLSHLGVGVPILGRVASGLERTGCRITDLAQHLGASIVNVGTAQSRNVRSIAFCLDNICQMVRRLGEGNLLVASARQIDRESASALATARAAKLAGLLITDDALLPPNLEELLRPAFKVGLPVISTPQSGWQTAINLNSFRLPAPIDDPGLNEREQISVASQLKMDWGKLLPPTSPSARQMSAAAFRHQIGELARAANKRIVLPEGDEPRTLKAAIMCSERKLARCVLLGSPNVIRRVARSQGLIINDAIEILDPLQIYEKYVDSLVELRKHKGMNSRLARSQLKNRTILATMMLASSEVDGLVSGAVHTTADTIRPALQLIKTSSSHSLVSSALFMLFPKQVVLYSDCAINIEPDAAQLAEIAIQSAESALDFNIEPRIALISYSTGNSGSGSSVDRVREATEIAQKRRPDLLIDGPLQYDAASVPEVAKLKAPTSQVAGRATVFIFPDLNTGNTTYKAVQRSANLLSIGPMLQGLRRPVNDLSRGALVEDIFYTIALTAIQASYSSPNGAIASQIMLPEPLL